MFAYCENNPINYSDPSGYCICSAGGSKSDFAYSNMCSCCGCASGGGGIPLILSASFFESIAETISIGISAAEDWIDEQKKIITDKLAASLSRATSREYRSEYEEHHIAAKRSKNAVQAANILNNVLPGGVEDPLNKVMVKTSVHRRIHTQVFMGL